MSDENQNDSAERGSMMIRATTLATEELRKVYEAGGPIHGLHSRADIGVLLAEITALRADIATWEQRYDSKAELAQMYSKAELALRNVLAHSRRLWKHGQLSNEDAGHFARFCESAGVEPSVLRDDG